MESNFELTPSLKQFLRIGADNRYISLGEIYPVSIRRRYIHSQSIEIFPDSNYDFFLAAELSRILQLANAVSLSACVKSRDNVVVIEVTDYLPFS